MGVDRLRCRKKGHRWIESFNGWRPPVQFCRRWFCPAARPDPLLPIEVQAALDGRIATGEIPEIEYPSHG